MNFSSDVLTTQNTKAPSASTKQKKGRNKAKHINKQKPTNQTKTIKAEKKITELKGPTRPVTTLFLFICMGISITI